MDLGAPWRWVKFLIWSRRIGRRHAVMLFWDMAQRPARRTADQVHRLLDAWGFDKGYATAQYFVQAARVRWHRAMPGAERRIVIEESGYLYEHRVSHVIDVIRDLAAVLGVQIDPP